MHVCVTAVLGAKLRKEGKARCRSWAVACEGILCCLFALAIEAPAGGKKQGTCVLKDECVFQDSEWWGEFSVQNKWYVTSTVGHCCVAAAQSVSCKPRKPGRGDEGLAL